MPSTVRALREREGDGGAPYRVLTSNEPFAQASPSPTPVGFAQELQPDTYMMHGVENAAGYDGFGLARYSRLAGDMKLWGELPDAGRSLRGEGREFDILNVRYLIAARAAVHAPRDDEKGADVRPEPAPLPAPEITAATPSPPQTSARPRSTTASASSSARRACAQTTSRSSRPLLVGRRCGRHGGRARAP